ncbi:restriction endonuclease subunit S [Aeromicrobium duanguangcaii]|nr:restriction endonuclease subunit S [Aeromicrobium duanguangcaii]MCD9153112.1 restriction endonuclease subunit S [Aeromicrobium duanguangcaii]
MRPDLLMDVRTNTQANLNARQVGDLWIPAPPSALQAVVADYLDRETAQIDNLIAEQERLIELLRERRQAVIDSVFDSVEAPRGQLRRAITFLTSGSRGWGDYYADAGARFLRIGNLPRRSLALRGQVQRISLPEGVTEGERTKLQLHDLLFSITAYLGSVAVVDAAWAGGYVSQHVALCRMDSARLEPHFVGWSMLATNGQHQLNAGAAGGTKVQLALDDIRGLEVAYPSLEEQRRIVELLDDQTAKIDQLIAEAELLIGLARERRSALITAAVTGQIEIPEAS